MNSYLRLLCLTLLGLVALSPAAQAEDALPAGFERVELDVDGVAREALVYAPPKAKTTRTPVVLGFHGHGGTAAAGAREFAMNREWPEAISVYMQALNTPGRFIDFEGKQSGWQLRQGHEGDRDLKFFDALLERLKQDYKVDEKRVYAVGNSSGGYFTYLLWATRGEVLAAVAPAASEAADNLPVLKPKPVLFVGGEKDQRVKYEWMRTTMDAVRKLNGCAAEGSPWGERCMLFPSASGTPVAEFIHSGGHEYPKGANAAIARFFKEHPKGGVAEENEKKVCVDFRDIHGDGKVAVLGHFGIPIGKNVTVEGSRAKASKVSNEMTLHVTKVNGIAAAKRGESPLIQIQNVDSLPEDEPIIVEGYEFLSWRGDPESNWHVDVGFMITKVVAPKGLKVNARTP